MTATGSSRRCPTSLPRVRLQGLSLSDRCAVLKRPRSRGTRGDDAIPRLQRGIYRFGRCGGQGVVFGVEMDVFYLFRADGLEGT